MAISEKQAPINEEQLAFITVMHQHWMETGTLMSAATCRKDFGVAEKQFGEWLATPAIREALEERGVILERFSLDKVKGEGWEKSLTPQQLVVANVMLDLTDTRSNKKKLQDLHVSTAKYNAWLRDPVFSGYLRERAEAMLGDTQHEAMLALMDKVSQGDTKAIQYYHELIGRFVPESNKASNTNNLDLQSILIAIIEIIADEVDDPQVADRIGERLKTLGQQRQTVQAILGEETIALPSVAPARVMSGKMQELMDSGAGVNA